MFKLRMRVKVGPALRPEEFSTPELFETKVEEIISLGLQTTFEFAEITDIDYEGYEELPIDEEPTDESRYLPDDLL